jgi:hypothetical protein
VTARARRARGAAAAAATPRAVMPCEASGSAIGRGASAPRWQPGTARKLARQGVTVITSLLDRSSHRLRAAAGYRDGMIEKSDTLKAHERVVVVLCVLALVFVAQVSWHYLFG